tara:strand:- start:261 stop:788 length:528 start_codon:yes stop_codon:yes gene_type:complete
MRRGVYPGSFNPPTVGHVAIVETAIQQHNLTSIDLTISEVALAKPIIEKPSLEERIRVLETSFVGIPQVNIVRTDLQLIADIAYGYDLVVMGADKWIQIQDENFYDDVDHMRECISRLPQIAVAPRGEIVVPEEILLEVPETIAAVSSSLARETNFEWMTEAAQNFSNETGSWSS